MNLPKQYAKALRRGLRAQAVWPPLQAIEPGDYGEYDGGIFTRIGNLKTDFGVSYVVETGARRGERFAFHSESSRGGEIGLQGGAAGAAGGAQISLTSESSFFVSLSECDAVRLQSPRAVASALREVSGWRHLRHFVVWELLRGRDLVFFGSELGGAAVGLHGNSGDLALFQSVGKVGASLRFSASAAAGVQVRGAPGELAGFAVNVFRVKAVGDPLLMDFDGFNDGVEKIQDWDDEEPAAPLT